MRDELQNIVEALARRVGRSVAIDDRNGRLLAYSSHAGVVDTVRTASILTRHAPADAWSWAMSFREAIDVAPTRLGANTELGMDARVGIGIVGQGVQLGFLWLIDPEESLSDADVEAATAAADTIGSVLYRERLLTELELGRERELLRDLVTDDVNLRAHAAGELVEANLFTPSTPVVALVVEPAHPEGRAVDEAVRLAVGAALEGVRRALSPRYRLHLVRPDHGLLLIGMADPSMPPGGIDEVANRLRDSLVEHLTDQEGWNAFVGVGGEQPALADAATSYRQAGRAVRVAQIVRSFDPVVTWTSLGIYRLLTQLPIEDLAGDVLHPGLGRLLASSGGEQLAASLEAYLDRGGDAKATAAALFLHRASLYYRLRKIEDLTGTNLRDGEDRLALHLGLKVARLAGIYPSEAAEAPAARVEAPSG